jgi:alpha-1,3-rhamnosyltransferase
MNKDRQNSEVFAFVPSYNHAPFIEKCLNSIIGQTLPPAKLLVIDDGSRDDSPKIIERILKDCPFDAELVVRENRGLCRTLNEGFARSAGKYFAYVGSDDYWLPGFFAERVKLMDARENAVLAFGHALLIDGEGKIFDSTANYTDSWANYRDGDARPMLLKGHAPISSTIFYRRAALENVRWNEASRLEDYEMYLKLMNLGDFAFDPQVLSVWRHHSYNTSGNLQMMMNEVVDAQIRNFDDLGIDRQELEKIQRNTRFRYAREFLQSGDKRQALNVALENWRGASSKAELAKFALRMFVPMSVVNWRRRQRKTTVTK